jgi:hypothetical protein
MVRLFSASFSCYAKTFLKVPLVFFSAWSVWELNHKSIPLPMTSLKQSKTTFAATSTWRPVVACAVISMAKSARALVAASHREIRAKHREVV